MTYTAEDARAATLKPVLQQNLELIKYHAERGLRNIYAYPGNDIEKMAVLLRQHGFATEITHKGIGLSVTW